MVVESVLDSWPHEVNPVDAQRARSYEPGIELAVEVKKLDRFEIAII